ncbi:MAG: hypothetical protein ACE5KJ_07175 [Candidatus Zixiibacteriota bacterium]
MRRSNPKVFFDPGFSVAKKILSLAVLGCVLLFPALVYAGGEFDPDSPLGEHPWDELQSESDHLPPIVPGINDAIVFPWRDFGGWIIIYFPQSKDRNLEKDQVQVLTSGRNQGRFFIFF